MHLIRQQQAFLLHPVRGRRPVIAPLALRVRRTRAHRRDAIGLRTPHLRLAGGHRVEMQAHEQIRAGPVRQRRTIRQFHIHVPAAGEDHVETGFFELVAQLQRQRQRVSLFAVAKKCPPNAIARVPATVAGIEADRRDLSGRSLLREKQRTDRRVQVQLRDQRHALHARHRKRKPHVHAVDLHVVRIHVEHQPRRAVCQNDLIPAIAGETGEAVPARPFHDGHIIPAIDERRGRWRRATHQTQRRQQR